MKQVILLTIAMCLAPFYAVGAASAGVVATPSKSQDAWCDFMQCNEPGDAQEVVAAASANATICAVENENDLGIMAVIAHKTIGAAGGGVLALPRSV